MATTAPMLGAPGSKVNGLLDTWDRQDSRDGRVARRPGLKARSRRSCRRIERRAMLTDVFNDLAPEDADFIASYVP